MGKLYFRYGAMGSSKTANAIMVRYNYLEKGQNCILLKPGIENRDGEKIVKSRMGLSADCIFVEDFLDEVVNEWFTKKSDAWKKLDCVLVDEAQFLTEEQVDLLAEMVDRYDLPCICYGLRTDFQEKFFPGSARLMEIADKIEEVKTVCWCGRKATCNARICDGRIVRDGEQVFMGGNESYIALCRKHFKKGKLTI